MGPIDLARKEFLKLIKRNQTVVLVGETGSGKTTQLPQFLLEALGFSHYHVSKPMGDDEHQIIFQEAI